MFCNSSEKMAVSFTIISNVAVTTRVSINKKGADLFTKGIFKLLFSFREKLMFVFCPYKQNVPISQAAHWNFLQLCYTVLLPNVNFLSSKLNKAPKPGATILKNVLSFTQTNRTLQSNKYRLINKYLYCNELHHSLPCVCFNSSNILNMFSSLDVSTHNIYI